MRERLFLKKTLKGMHLDDIDNGNTTVLKAIPKLLEEWTKRWHRCI